MTRILIKMPNWVGDCVMTTPAIALIRAAFPDATIDALCRPSVAGILLDNPHLSEIITMHDKKMSNSDLQQLKNGKYEAIALMTNSLGSAWLAFKLRIRHRIGFNREGRFLLLTNQIPYDPLEWTTPTPQPLSRRSIKGQPRAGLPRHMVEYYLKIAAATVSALAPEKLKSLPATDFKMILPLDRGAESRVATMLRNAGIMGKTLIGINPGAAHGPAKRWSPERLGHMVEGLDRPDWAFISTSAPGEKELNDRVQSSTSVPIHRLGEQTSLRDLPALISRMSVLITNDSGAMHVAAARQIPTIAVFGPTDWASTKPWEAPFTLVNHPVPCSPCFLEKCPINHPCMDGVEAFTVASAVLDRLHRSDKWTPRLAG